MKKLMMTLALLAGLALAAPSAFAHGGGHGGGVHVGGGIHVGGGYVGGGIHVGGGHYNPGYNHGYYPGYNHGYNHGYYRPGIGIYVNPFPYYSTPAAITVLVADQFGTHYVTAYWDNLRGGYWYYDSFGVYRRAR